MRCIKLAKKCYFELVEMGRIELAEMTFGMSIRRLLNSMTDTIFNERENHQNRTTVIPLPPRSICSSPYDWICGIVFR